MAFMCPALGIEVGRRQLGWRAVRLQKKHWEGCPMKAGQVQAVMAGGLCGMATIFCVFEGPGRSIEFESFVL